MLHPCRAAIPGYVASVCGTVQEGDTFILPPELLPMAAKNDPPGLFVALLSLLASGLKYCRRRSSSSSSSQQLAWHDKGLLMKPSECEGVGWGGVGALGKGQKVCCMCRL